ncbi:RNA methyltransferase [Actibacterium mucosum KCTC 23349]|uniref:RNA methyltransferase n=1 Tax=Actibacterium mucosum KCTC 23349 TaxID=1454373 RepID=A0A037ZI66_9RHOB|nr:RNA methyltransferase [Actibacterium mucosum]KAJ54495.1 RNA methyltransferase [Actibacterium mucosum KCTC 23349]
MNDDVMEVFLACAPGLEATLADEARAAGFVSPKAVAGGVETRGNWPEVWRANLTLRGAARVIVRIGGFPVFHLAQLDKRSHKFPWADHLRREVPVKVEVTCRKSKIYHAGAAAQRIETALKDTLGAEISAEAPVRLLARIEANYCTFSLDSSGEPLHRRGHKVAVNKAPMRETMAAMFLRECGFRGDEPVLDPMCGSGTFVLEAAEIAAGLDPGRSRDFGFQKLAGFDDVAWQSMRVANPHDTPFRFFGSDRDQGAVQMAQKNAERAAVSTLCDFQTRPISEIAPPTDQRGLVIVNPPYGGRIGNKNQLFSLYGALGKVLRERFSGWRVGIVTAEAGLARATGLNLSSGPFVAHGSLKVKLHQSGPL